MTMQASFWQTFSRQAASAKASTVLVRPAIAVLLALGLTACATAPAADLTAPPRKPCDAKTALESGRRC